ncbi:diguanylate cyclase (GGDEF) domain-containing protein [Allopseudospirillum japonicum]|uniref:Diguanylate cyclase (GGDEF) domain-containing protein n=1 Tax=Allopseudospirillum japonicum TaxID=64971 RepID=A0A1H6SQV6_9GAMM|nr:GGDEF domain-containing protein [Allopseudospirillum japonicum]SEI68224.1 diguanylate cyclase (GGDEF) domain-containing protein [Allopseudospirillum japonicum]
MALHEYSGIAKHKIVACIYAALAILLAATALQAYYHAWYSSILLPALSAPLIASFAVYRWLITPIRQDLTAYPVLALLALQAWPLANIPQAHVFLLHYDWLMLLPLLGFFLLPLKLGTYFALTMAGFAAWHTYHLHWPWIQVASQYLIFSGTGFLLAADQAWQLKRLENFSIRDRTTGAFNINHLHQRLIAEVSRARTTQRPLSLLLIELNQYPQLVQEYGSTSADTLLAHSSRILIRTCRVGDELYRYDAQTLVLLLPNTTTNGSLVLRERLYHQLLDQLDSPLGPVDVSMTPLTLIAGESAAELEERISNSCIHSLPERVQL